MTQREVGLLGLQDSDPDRPKLWFHHYVDPITTPIPAVFGHDDKVTDWGMLGNDAYGDCAWASSAHEVMVQNAANGRTVKFNDDVVLADYSAGTGFKKDDPSSDRGTSMFELYKYRKLTGIADADGKRHKIVTFLEIEHDADQLAAAAYLFGVAGIGISVYDWAQEQFANHQPWSYKRGGKLEGGHAIPVVGRLANGNFKIVTWGGIQEMTPTFFEKMANSVFVGVTQDYLTGDKSPEALNSAQLIKDMPLLNGIK